MNDPELTAEAVRALNEGRKVEGKYHKEQDEWDEFDREDVGTLFIRNQLDSSHVRIAPAPKFVPWDADDVPVGAVVRRDAKNSNRCIIACALPNGVYIGQSDDLISYQTLLEEFVQTTGAPCGKAVQS